MKIRHQSDTQLKAGYEVDSAMHLMGDDLDVEGEAAKLDWSLDCL